jgi:predicted phage terminase large subunit-like protein
VTIEAPLEKLLRLRELRRQVRELQVANLVYPTPGALAQALDPTVIQTPALELIDAALVEVGEGRNDRLIISLPPQEGKSQRASRRFPSWMLLRNQDLRIAIVSFEHRTARRWGRIIRDDLITHDLLPIDQGISAANEWQIAGRIGGVYATGIGGALTGRPVDLLIIDDPIKDREQADSETYRETVWDWWTDVGSTRLAPGAPVVLILTRWHEDDLAGRLLGAENGHRWRVINIPAQADHDPEKGQTDLLGREPGEWLESARRRTVEQWEEIKIEKGSRTFTALFQGRPSPDSGDVLHRDWWGRYTTRPWSQQPDGSYLAIDMDEVIQSWDMAFKDTKSSDFVVGQVWGRRGAEAFLLDQVHARLSFTGTLQAVLLMTTNWPQAKLKLVEDKANGTAVIDTLRAKVGGIVPVTPHESKYARASAVSPFVEAGNVWLPSDNLPDSLFDVRAFVDEAAAFPNGAHDDQVDAFSQAIHRLLYSRGGGIHVFDDDEPTTAPDGSPLQPMMAGLPFAGDTRMGLVSEDSDQEDNGKVAVSPFA